MIKDFNYFKKNMNDISEIIPNRLYLTSLQGATENNLKVDIIVTIMETPKLFTDVFYQAEDDDDFDIHQYFDPFYHLMESNKDKKVLVHCYSGVSRSATLVISYIMEKKYEETQNKKNKKLHLKHVNNTDFIKKVKKIRNIIDPNDGFVEILEVYQLYLSELFNKSGFLI